MTGKKLIVAIQMANATWEKGFETGTESKGALKQLKQRDKRIDGLWRRLLKSRLPQRGGFLFQQTVN